MHKEQKITVQQQRCFHVPVITFVFSIGKFLRAMPATEYRKHDTNREQGEYKETTYKNSKMKKDDSNLKTRH